MRPPIDKGQDVAVPDRAPAAFELAGEVDLVRADQLEPQLLAVARALGGDELEIDCSRLEFVDSSGLGMLVDVQHETGKDVVLRDLPTPCRRVFELTGLDRFFKLV